MEFIPEDHPYRFISPSNLANALITRFERRGWTDDLDEAIKLHYAALELYPEGHPDRSTSLNNLASSLKNRFQRHGREEDLDKAIDLHHAALELHPEGHPLRSFSLNNLANSFQNRFEQHGRADDLNKAIELHYAALELHPECHPDRAVSLNNLAISFQTRFEHYGRTEDLDKSIELSRATLKFRPEGHPKRSSSLDGLAGSLHMQFEQHGRAEVLDEAIELHCAALENFSYDDPDRYSSLSSLAMSLRIRFEQYGRTKDLDEAIELLHTSLELCPDDHPDRSASLTSLANALFVRFGQRGRAEDLSKAILHHRIALESLSKNHPHRSTSLSNLATSLFTRYEQQGGMEGLDEAITHHRAALQRFPEGHRHRSRCLVNLADALTTRFERLGQAENLDEGIALHRAGLELLPKGHIYHPRSLVGLANSLTTRFELFGQTGDLDEAVELYRTALELRPKGHSNRSVSLNNLASSLVTQFDEHGRTEDLDEAIALHRAALELHPNGHPLRFSSLNNLANSLMTRFEQHDGPEDGDEAVAHHRAALELLVEAHPHRSTSLSNLANSLATRFERRGQLEDLNEAMELHRAALECFPEGHPNRSASLKNLAFSLFSRYRKLEFVDDFKECIRLLEHASEHKFSNLLIRLESASQWARLAREYGHHTTSRAYKVAMSLMQRAFVVSPTLYAQHTFLNRRDYYRTLTVEAVSYAIQENELEQAVEILEQGRALIWSQMRGFRTSIDQLSKMHKGLADRFKSVGCRLENLVTSHETPISGPDTVERVSYVLDMHSEHQSFDEMLKLKRYLSDEQEEIIGEIRQIAGFESFLAATPFKVLQQAASEGPVIMVNYSEYRSDALIVLSREDTPVVCVPLDNEDGKFYEDFNKLCIELVGTRQRFKADSTEYDKILRRAMKTLWDRIVFKIVNKLRELGISDGSRIWWCPTSVLSALPFHAAGPFKDADNNSRFLLDKYISSYTPTLGALVNARSKGTGTFGAPTVLVIGDESLKSAIGEVRNIKNCGVTTNLLLKKASRSAVIKALGKTDWVHFVCHGNLHAKPFNSFFKLPELKQYNKEDNRRNQRLTLLDIVQGNVPNAEFAFLSACHTAEQPHDSVHDEVLHLAAAMQFSGFRSVIGSMWELYDLDGPLLARTIYEYMWECDEGEVRHKRAAAGLRKAAIELRARPEVPTERWVNLVHIGA